LRGFTSHRPGEIWTQSSLPAITGRSGSVGDAAALSQKYSHYPVEVDIGAGTLMPRCNALNITRAKDAFGYEPKYDLEAGIQDYADWIKKQI